MIEIRNQSYSMKPQRGDRSTHSIQRDEEAFTDLVRECLELTHHDVTTGEDLGNHQIPQCVAGCYDCLLVYKSDASQHYR